MTEPGVPTGEAKRSREVDFALNELWKDMPQIAQGLIAERLGSADPLNQAFYLNPDDPKNHKPPYHQWGIISHSKEFQRAYEQDIPAMVEEWGQSDMVNASMAQDIDGISRAELMRLVAPLHDLGKFTDRQIEQRYPEPGFGFKGHEATSGQLVRGPEMTHRLLGYGLTQNQIEYLAEASRLHFELAIIRNLAKTLPGGFTKEFVQSDTFKRGAEKIIADNPHMAVEIGIMYLADSIAKTNIALSDDPAIPEQERLQAMRAQITTQGLNPRIEMAALQQPVNMATGRRYLSILAEQAAQNGHIDAITS